MRTEDERREDKVLGSRLDKQDDQLNALLAKFDVVVRLEERHVALQKRVDLGDDRIHKHANLLMELQHRAMTNAKAVSTVERFFWIVVATGFSVVAFSMREFL